MDQNLILGLGAPAVDFIIKTDSQELKKLPGEIGGMVLVGYNELQELKKLSTVNPHISLGGCSLNKLKGLSRLGQSCRFAGKVGQDEETKWVDQGLHLYGIEGHLAVSKTPTAQVACLIDEYGHRTFRTYAGASIEFQSSDLNPSLFDGASVVVIEGYLLANGDLVIEAVKQAKKAQAKVVFDLACLEYCHQYKREIATILDLGVDLLFANSHEAKAILDANPYEACNKLRSHVGVSIVTMGEEGCWVGDREECLFVPAKTVRAPVDTTGAGDLFASGFIHGYLKGNSLEQCATMGAIVAHEVVNISGTDIPESGWNRIRSYLLMD